MPAINRRHLIAVTRSGTMIDDPKAWETDEELISDRGESSLSFDDDRMVPYYIMFEEGLPPTLIGYVQAYTGGSKAITEDDWWLQVKAPSIFYENANGLAEQKEKNSMSSRKVGLTMLGIGATLGAILLLLA